MIASYMEVNLLPNERVRDKYSFGIRTVSLSLLVATVIVFGFLGWSRNSHSRSDSITISSLKASQSQLQAQILALQPLMNNQRTTSSFLQGSSDLMIRPFVNQIQSALPQGATLTGVDISGYKITVNGNVKSINDIAQLEDSVAKFNNVANVTLVSITNTTANPGYMFSLIINLKGGENP